MHRSEKIQMNKFDISLISELHAQSIENSPDGILTFDMECRYTSWSPAMERITGVKAEAVIGREAFEIFPFLKQNGQDQYFHNALKGQVSSTPLRPFFVTQTQKSVFVESHFSPLRNREKEIVGGMSIVRDVSARAQKEANDQMFRLIAESIPHLVWVSDENFEVNYFNQRWYEYTGLEGETNPSDAISRIHPDDRHIVISAVDRSLKFEQPFEAESRLLGKDGKYRWFHTKGVRVLGIDGKLLRSLGTLTDIHDQKLAMQSSLEANERFSSLVEQTPFAFQLFDLAGNCIYANPAWEVTWQISREALNGYNIFNDAVLRGNGSYALMKSAFEGNSITLSDAYYEPSKNSRNGRARWIRAHFFPIRDAFGKFIQVACVLEDVTSQNSTRERHLFLDTATKLLGRTLEIDEILSSIGDLCVSKLSDLCMIDLLEPDGVSLRRVKVAATDPYLQAKASEIKKYPASTHLTANPSIQALSKMKTVLIKEFDPSWTNQTNFPSAHRDLVVSLNIRSIVAIPLIARGRAIGVLLAVFTLQSGRTFADEDVELLEELADRTASAIDNATLYQASRQALVARDTFLSIASHELKTPLTTLQLQLKFVQRQVYQEVTREDAARRLDPLIEETGQGIKRIARLVDDMLDISKITSGKFNILPESLDLASLSRDVCERLKSVAAEGESKIRLESSGPVYGEWDGLRIEQVLTNLITNAYRYGNKSEIVVRIWNCSEHAYLSVQDHGRGISDEDQLRIFERFERAISQYEVAGFGLGLYIAREIIRLHRGSITVESSLGVGSKFTVKVPLSYVEPENAETEA